jgi:hypothetical protein
MCIDDFLMFFQHLTKYKSTIWKVVLCGDSIDCREREEWPLERVIGGHPVKFELNYFAERPHDLLTLDICGGRADWEVLCSFLGVPVPNVPFPNTNRVDSLDETIIRLLARH